MNTNDCVEVSAATVEEAIRQALEQLGAVEADAVIEVLATPRAGVLGLGARQARVRASRRPPTGASSGVTAPPHAPPAPAREQRAPEPRPQRQSRPAGTESKPPREQRETRRQAGERRPEPQRDAHGGNAAESRPRTHQPRGERLQPREDEHREPAAAPREQADIDAQAGEATRTLASLLELMGEKAEVAPLHCDSEAIELEIKGDGSGILIGRHGQTLDALEYLINRMVARKVHDAITVVLETEAYRARRRQQLHRMALQMGEQAKRDHEPVKLEPMPPRDRRVVHLALKDDPMVTTRSSGEGFLRSVEIVPVDARRGEREGRPRGRREPREPREQKQPALGEQGGFKHGQKRIV
jgi:spoIIIJ-associated protein